MRAILAILVILFVASCVKPAAPQEGSSPGGGEAEGAAQENAGGQASGVSQESGGGAVTVEQLREKSRAEIDEAACKAAGGEVRQAGLLGMYHCVKPYADAGKACRSSDDCQGKCLAAGDEKAGEEATGQCQASDSPFGCYAEIVDGKVGHAICVD